MANERKIGVISASSFVIANMVGTGVFTSLGFQLLTTSSPISIIILWVLGGVIAICGALAYGELGTAMPRSGGEYHYLSVIYNPAVGFLSGWVSLLVGFAAPVAIACMALSNYVCMIFPQINPMVLSLIVLTGITLLHSFSVSFGAKAQNFLTVIKLLIIVFFIIAGLAVKPDPQSVIATASSWTFKDILTPGFAVALIWVYYSYSGWNASAYIVNELENPQKSLPRSLLISTIIVILLYVLLNFVFMRTAPASELTGTIEVGLVSANHMFGQTIGQFIGMFIAFLLMSSISSMVFIGPRVTQVMGEDHKMLRFLAKKNSKNVPLTAIWFQFAISALLVLTNSFSLVTKYTGVLISFFALLTVIGVFVHRFKFPDIKRTYKTWGYPVTPAIFAILIIWSIVYLFYEDFVNTFITHDQHFMWMTTMSLATLGVGYIIYLINNKLTK